jgi:hypothetical protein
MRFLTLAAVLAAGPATAFEIVAGVGYDDLRDLGDGGVGAALVEARTDPLLALGPVGLALGGAGEVDLDGDLWGGAGPVLLWSPWGAGLRLEGSVMAGGYAEGDDGTDLGAALIFRSQIGASYPLGARTRLGVALNHKSNAGLEDENPGVETVFVTLGHAF